MKDQANVATWGGSAIEHEGMSVRRVSPTVVPFAGPVTADSTCLKSEIPQGPIKLACQESCSRWHARSHRQQGTTTIPLHDFHHVEVCRGSRDITWAAKLPLSADI